MSAGGRTARIGVDVGGTFTDLVLYDESRDRVWMGKLLTTPDDPSAAILEGIAGLVREAGLSEADLHSVVHGTTLVTNAIIERKGCKVGLLTTKGFRDSLEIGRETRYDLYDLFLDLPPMLVPRARRLEIPERISAQGKVLVALRDEDVAAAARELVETHGVDAIAVSFMHSYRCPDHEIAAGRVIGGLYPDLPVSLSAEVAPEIREYERGTTTCANAYVQPLMQRYLLALETALKGKGFAGSLYIMLSGGGITSVADARKYPIRLIESGPAAGALIASSVARLAGLDKVVSFDMGGTTAKMCLIDGGHPDHKFEFEAGRMRRFQKGSGIPLKISVIDMIEIGAGGGSLARVDDSSGLLKVGPHSAGSKPGPVCYGLGGRTPTVTDADLLLGRLDAAYFLGGDMSLDSDAVQRAFREEIASSLGMEIDATALGVQRIVDETMAAATRMHFAEKGKDPRKHTMVAFGGAGPVHAWNLARLLKMKRLVVPLGAGVASALGFLVAPPATDMVRSYVSRLDRVDWEFVGRIFAEMARHGRALLVDAGADPGDISYLASAEMRYVGQGFEIPVDLPGLAPSGPDVPTIRQSFDAVYSARFGRCLEDSPIEVLSWRLSCRSPGREIAVGRSLVRASGEPKPRACRAVRFEEEGWLDCPVYDRYALPAESTLEGPAVIEERESTCVVGPGSTVLVDRHMNLVIDINSKD